MPDGPLFQKGDSVVLRSTRELARVESEPIRDAGEYWYRVRFVKRVDNIVEDDLDPLDEADDSLRDLATHGRWGRIQAFRCALAVERITHTNRSTVYSFKAQRLLFEPYQYKPLLKILDSPDRRLLIADEVGLGKTIEAGLILTELEARKPLERILIVCPSRLREKWREELNRKFDQEFDIHNKRSFLDYVDRLRQNPRRSRLRGVVSMQTLRSEELRELLTGEIGHLDLVIVDEAHHARNAPTQTSELLRDLCEVADCVLLLTATPVHLGSRDLFTLLQALRPVEFRDAEVFDRDLKRHAGVHDASRVVRSLRSDLLDDARRRLEQIFVKGIPSDRRDPLALQVIEELQSSAPTDRRGWVEIERRIQELHPLSSIVTRTRKRDVQEHAPVRRAAVFRCQWTPEEDYCYQQLVHDASAKGWFREQMGFGQIQRARQAASCLPAAVEAHGFDPANTDDDSTENSDILPSEVPDARRSAEMAKPTNNFAWSGRDSKYEKLREILNQTWSEEPNAKILIFTFFVGTSKYLLRRLTEAGIGTLRIAGDVPSNPHQPERDERGAKMRQFHEDPHIRVLVSTEVGSEGLDFQFCHHVVNYDLPWNPMVVEQRIGRIDRFGQEHDVVYIHNLVVEGTVEDRILVRLYERIGIFRESIGDLEVILGETISELQRDYLTGKLTPDEADERVEQAARAINQRRHHLEQLERNSGELFGHEEYIRDEMNRVSRLGRFISQESQLAVIRSYLESHHPDISLWQESPGIYGLRLTDALRQDIQEASRGSQLWIERGRNNQMLITTQGEVAFRHPEVELINVSHPLLRAAVLRVRDQLQSPVSRAGQTILRLNSKEDHEIPSGVFFVLVFLHTVDGIRARRLFETVVWCDAEQRLLEPELGERLLHLTLEKGDEWDSATEAPAIDPDCWNQLEAAARTRSRELREREGRENAALYNRRKRAIHAEYEHDRRVKEARLRTAEERGHQRVLPAMRGQLQKSEAEFRARLAELEQTKEVSVRLSDPVAACVVEVRRST
jgi:superfamily II DNA or RNA helicase